MRVAIVTSQRVVNSVYRALPLLELRRDGFDVQLDAEGEAMAAGRLRGFDLVHVFRYHERETRRAIRALREAGAAIVWDNDDDLSSPNKLRSDQIHTQLVEMLQLAHVVTTTSPVLAQQYRAWGAAETRVVENYLPDYYSAERPPRGEGVVIGWTAAGEHAYDLRALGIRQALQRLLDAHPEVRVASAGLQLGLARERYAYTEVVQYQELARYVGGFDVGIAPIADIPFNRAKSNVKLKEYAAMGVPWLASPIGPYEGLGEKQGGRLVPDDRWHDELERLIRDERARRKLAKRGVKWGDGQRLRRNMDGWRTALERAAELAGAGRSAPAAR
ncbi:MAG TPA: glycosyltransferase [Conexibacter sp.]|nr:glycosyltransferase [Conexibacter sp.]